MHVSKGRKSVVTGQVETYRARAIGTNVNAISLLATDYLNHFNEALMLAELLVDMPDMVDEFVAWQPKHYRDHFRDSGIADRDLAIEAYDISPMEYREPFDKTVSMINKQLTLLQKSLQIDKETLLNGEKNEFLLSKCELIRTLIDKAGGIINGHLPETASVAKQKALNEVSASASSEEKSVVKPPEGDTLDQADIDALFD